MKSAGAIFPNRLTPLESAVGRGGIALRSRRPACRKKQRKKQEKREGRGGNRDHKSNGEEDSLHFLFRDRVFVSPVFFPRSYTRTRRCGFCRFVGHVRDVNYQNATGNDRQIEARRDVSARFCARGGRRDYEGEVEKRK